VAIDARPGILGLKITVIGTSANTVAQTVPVGGFVGDVALSPDGSRLYASNLELLANGAAQQVISVINTASFAISLPPVPQLSPIRLREAARAWATRRIA